jgi:ADP-heptose:LPS heptosyltransferase
MGGFLKRFCGSVVMAVDWMAAGFHAKSHTKASVGPIALIRLDAIGDFVLWLDAARHLRTLYPGRYICLLANAAWCELAQGLSYWDEVIPIDVPGLVRRPLYRWRSIHRISRRKFSLAIYPTYSRDFWTGDAVLRATRAAERIGYDGDISNSSPTYRRYSDRWYTRLVPARPGQLTELRRNAEFMSHLGGLTLNPALATLPQRAGGPHERQAAYCILFPGASWSGKRWPAEHFVELGVRLRAQGDWRIVLCGSSSERNLCDRVAHALGGDVLNLAGKTSLVQLTEWIRSAKLLVSNDTSATHIAAAVGTASVCILGGGHFGRFLPYDALISGRVPKVAMHEMPCFHCNWNCTQPHRAGEAVPCISQVSVAQVFALALEALAPSAQRTT